jgi:nicotinamidase-related amidase
MELNVFLDRISEPARCAIEQLHCTKLEDLLSYSDKELLALHGLGPKTIRILYDFLEENKLDRNPKRSALLVIDVQEALLEENPYHKEELIQNINTLIRLYRSKKSPIFFIRHDGGKGDTLAYGEEGWQLAKTLDYKDEPIIDKKYNSAFKNTNLESSLQALKINHLVIVGIQTEYCVDATLKSAFEKGYQCDVIKGCTSTYDNPWLKADQLIDFYEQAIWPSFARIIKIEETHDGL